MKQITINKNDANKRLDAFIHKIIPQLPPSLMYKYLRTKRIKLNGGRTDGKTKLCEGDTLDLYINDEFFTSDEETARTTEILKSIKPNLDIVYEDANIIITDKPYGLIAHEDENESFNTLINRVKGYLYQKGEYDPEAEQSFAPALCHRIDRNTAGLVIAAKNAEALRIVNEQIKKRSIDKHYLCLVHGEMQEKEQTLTAYLKKDASENKVEVRNKPFNGALAAVTKYKVLQVKADQSLLEVELITGRTHQIRAHLAHMGHPLVGDGKYGKLEKGGGRRYQALYAYKLRFNFEEDAASLQYLNGKTVKIDMNKIDFVNFGDKNKW